MKIFYYFYNIIQAILPFLPKRSPQVAYNQELEDKLKLYEETNKENLVTIQQLQKELAQYKPTETIKESSDVLIDSSDIEKMEPKEEVESELKEEVKEMVEKKEEKPVKRPRGRPRKLKTVELPVKEVSAPTEGNEENDKPNDEPVKKTPKTRRLKTTKKKT